MQRVLLTLLFSISTHALFAQDAGFWRDIAEPAQRGTMQRVIVPIAYRTVSVDMNAAKTLFSTAPNEFSTGGTIVTLPMPDGTAERFAITQNGVMSPELAAKYPDIKTYSGQGVDNPTSTARLDLTPQGFHAVIFTTEKGSIYIDPYAKGDTENYIVYFKKDFVTKKNDGVKETTCKADESSMPASVKAIIERALQHPKSVSRTGPQLRTYRLALACTGEYAAFHGGTRTGALAAMVTSINRVTGVYQKEIASRFVLIPNTDTLIFLNANTDPYTNSSGPTMLGENQATVDAIIGNANYDVGHVFSTGGGGIASLGSICITGFKARGVTGSPAPVGDPFDIDYVAHELGHQFGGRHTFNSVTGSCGDGNRSAIAAYEIGSGTTIMAYAGICGGDNIQNNSNDYFHARSLDEMNAVISGSGSCAVVTNTGNQEPTASTGISGFTIPIGTPFTITGSGSDPDGDSLTYCWEQWDLGNGGSPAQSATDPGAPNFRSFLPTRSPSRTFPRLQNLLANTTNIGEVFPTISRTLNFRLTVRDNRASAGGVFVTATNSLYTIQTDAASGPFVVTSPNNNATIWTAGTRQAVVWNVANTNAAPCNVATVRITLSTDGGNTFPVVLNNSTANDGSDSIDVPNISSTQARVRIEAIGNIFFDISNQNFIIETLPAGLVRWSEGFEGTTFPPAGWLAVTNAGSQTWQRSTSPVIFGTGSAFIRSEGGTVQNDNWLIAPRIQALSNTRFSFWAKRALRFGSFRNDTILVKVSTGARSVASFSAELARIRPTDTVASRYEVSLSAYAGQPVFVALHYNVLNQGNVLIDSVMADTARFSSVSMLNTQAKPTRYALEQNYPNPFNPSTGIRYQVSGVSDVRLEVFDMLGRKVSTLVNERQAAGAYQAIFNAANLASGVYFYRLQAGAFVETRKMMLVR
jgi:hypothetical protein